MLQIRLLGTLQLALEGQPIKFAALPKAAPLLAYLLLHTKSVARTRLAFSLWSDVGEEEARSNLRRHLYELRRVLPPEIAGCPWILTEGNTVQWNPESSYWLDVAHYAECRANPTRLSEAVALYTGDLLTDLGEEWLYFERERLRNLFLDDATYTLIKPSLLAKPTRQMDEHLRVAQLSPEETQLLRLIAIGYDTDQISQQLEVTSKTISNRLSQLYLKLSINNRVQAANFALRNGIVLLSDTI